MNFSFVTHMSIPIPRVSEISTIQAPEFAFSADGSKFAMATDYGRVFFLGYPKQTSFKDTHGSLQV